MRLCVRDAVVQRERETVLERKFAAERDAVSVEREVVEERGCSVERDVALTGMIWQSEIMT